VARTINKLTPLSVSKEKEPGSYGDGGGLWLQIGPTGGKSWLFRFTLNGKPDNMGLGPVHTVTLAEARQAALAARKLVLQGVNPRSDRDARLQGLILSSAKATTFSQCAESYIEVHRSGWKNPKHIAQWTSTMATYANPTLGKLPVAAIDTGLVMKCLEPIWTKKTETASRVRGRIESILDWAKVKGFRSGENPARWKGHLDHLLPKRTAVKPVKHHAALPYSEMAKFLAKLQSQNGIAALALEFTILTAVRTGDVIGATWDEFSLDDKLWIIQPDRRKVRKDLVAVTREHRVPLSDRAAEIVKAMEKLRTGDYVFPGQNEGDPLSNMAMLETLRRMGMNKITVHGFRSTFRDWAAEETDYAGELAEMALAHVVSDKVEAAYRRGDLFKKRHLIMADWANHCLGKTKRTSPKPKAKAKPRTVKPTPTHKS
jgi:integrase